MARAVNKAEAGGTAHLVAALAKGLREQQQMSQERLGKKTGYTGSAVSAMETCAQPASDKGRRRTMTGSGTFRWFKSSYSDGGGDCLEVAYAWRKFSFNDSSGGNCVEVAYEAPAET
jgi:hypothetical protein